MPVPVLLLVGATGTGKSDTSYHLFSRLWRSGTPTARLDGDDLGMCHPAPEDDVDNFAIKAEATAAAWRVFESHGARCLVVSTGIDSVEWLEVHRRAIPDADWTVVRLRIGAEERRRRIIRRGGLMGYDEAELEPNVEAGIRDEARYDTQTWPDHVIDTDGLSSQQVVDEVLAKTGWPGLPG